MAISDHEKLNHEASLVDTVDSADLENDVEEQNVQFYNSDHIKVKLISASPLKNIIIAARTSHDSHDRSDTVRNNYLGDNDVKLLRKLIQMHHDSVLEHVVYTFTIDGISRALLQELVRHRIASYTVQSTRYTLGRALAKHTEFDIVASHCVLPESEYEDKLVDELLDIIRVLKMLYALGVPNDTLKYMLPECWKTSLVLTVNARELAHILSLRLSPRALWEFRILARKLLEQVRMVHPQLWDIMCEERNICMHSTRESGDVRG